MDTRQLQIFMTKVDMESFTRAGRRLGLSQSAISQRLGALERLLADELDIGLVTLPVAVRRQLVSRVASAMNKSNDERSAAPTSYPVTLTVSRRERALLHPLLPQERAGVR